MIITTDTRTIDLNCKLTATGFVWLAEGLDRKGRDATIVTSHNDALTMPENAKATLERFLEVHLEGHAAFTIAPCDDIKSRFVAVELTQ